jgi:putative endonuclease
VKQFHVYILTDAQNGTLYTGVTSDLIRRVYEHRNELVEGFTDKYKLHMLVWFETHGSADAAIAREKQVKGWKRKWKLELIEDSNPEWDDLYETLNG